MLRTLEPRIGGHQHDTLACRSGICKWLCSMHHGRNQWVAQRVFWPSVCTPSLRYHAWQIPRQNIAVRFWHSKVHSLLNSTQLVLLHVKMAGSNPDIDIEIWHRTLEELGPKAPFQTEAKHKLLILMGNNPYMYESNPYRYALLEWGCTPWAR